GNGSLAGDTAQTVDYGTDGTAVTATPNIGYQFVQWSDGSTANPRSDTNVMADVNVTAEFALVGEPGRIVIGEIRFRGPNGASDEFIELYNAGESAVNLGGFTVNGSNSSGTTGTRFTIPSDTILNPGCHYLAANSLAYSGAV